MAPGFEPARHGRGVPLTERPIQDGLGEAIDLEQDHAGNLGPVGVADPARPPADEAELAGVLVDAERRRKNRETGREDEGDQDRAAEIGRVAVDDLDRERDDRRVQNE